MGFFNNGFGAEMKNDTKYIGRKIIKRKKHNLVIKHRDLFVVKRCFDLVWR